MEHAFAHPWLLLALLAFPVLAVLGACTRWRQQRALARFGPRALPAARLGLAGRLRGFSVSLGLLCVGIGLAGPQWGRDWGQATAPGRDLMVVLDCSRSMFSESPSRMERARNALLDLATTLRHRGGTRVGLVVFASRARLLCPLTHDLDHFREMVQGLSLDGPDPDLESEDAVSGTRIGLGLALAVQAHDGSEAGARDILLLSDGDDPARDGEWQRGVARARAEKIPVSCIGIGDVEDHPIRIGPGSETLRQGNREVRTRLEEAPLREIAGRTGGQYTLAGTRSLALGEYYLNTLAQGPLREDSPDALPVYQQRPAWFLLPAFVLLALGLVLPDQFRSYSKVP
jgi:Ca-activated chloride channel family protein